MRTISMLSLILLLFSISRTNAQHDCNPLQKACPPIPGPEFETFFVDFTKQSSLPKGWVISNYGNVTFTPEGARFWYNKQGDAPYLWTDFYFTYGRVDVELLVASGTGIITSSVLFSDDQDEIDWEFSGSNFAHNSGKAFTNYFGKGVTGNYDRGTIEDVAEPQKKFHTYSFDWTPTSVNWLIDGKVLRTLQNNGVTTGDHQYPQTPSRLHVGLWDAGTPKTAEGTVLWAGGFTDYKHLPYSAILKSAKIVTANLCESWEYPSSFSGAWSQVKCNKKNIKSSTTVGKSTTAASGVIKTTSTSTKVASTTSTTTKLSSASTKSSSTMSSTTRITTSTSIQVLSPTATSSKLATSKATTATTVSASAPSGWSYKYCAIDLAYPRALAHKSDTVSWETADTSRCIKYCDSKGYTIAGLEWSVECWCGNEVNNSSQVSERECSMKCSGNPSEICGNNFRISLYAKDGARLPSISQVGQSLAVPSSGTGPSTLIAGPPILRDGTEIITWTNPPTSSATKMQSGQSGKPTTSSTSTIKSTSQPLNPMPSSTSAQAKSSSQILATSSKSAARQPRGAFTYGYWKRKAYGL